MFQNVKRYIPDFEAPPFSFQNSLSPFVFGQTSLALCPSRRRSCYLKMPKPQPFRAACEFFCRLLKVFAAFGK